MKKGIFIFVILMMFFICLLSPSRLPLVPETIVTASAERVDTLKVEETIPGVYVERDYDLFNYYHDVVDATWYPFET
ncbi:MAG: hypothetical protein DRO23_08815, partial [Thermoprotei archaeon]